MVNECCTNELCVRRDTQLRLARLREELLTNFNSLLIDRIRFLEQTVNRLSLISSSSSLSSYTTTSIPVPLTDKLLPPEIVITDRLTVPSSSSSSLRRSTSETTHFLYTPDDPNSIGSVGNLRTCPSSDDLSNNSERRKWFLAIKTSLCTKERASLGCNNDYLSTPVIHRQWARSANDISSSTNMNEKTRLESRRFATDVDDNDVRAFKAMVYTEQARKQNARPLTRLRHALGIPKQ
ncbi:unnamed protein product [Adineta steineri]|uniref:Uncharacterized protein n=1 Tax=Adineta steineri TaxID=433720 RepID=A0A819GA95_9BILA|nr:unnamed protein product [Adineta steineri]CAF3617833.1 unnamed protein product [Adineta steineri]CAF3878889.1 unnamed protein product [Adineta steineri]